MIKSFTSVPVLTYNWDGKLRSAAYGTDTIDLRYDPQGSRIYKETDNGSTTVKRKYIVDIVGDLPVILLELDPDSSNAVKKTCLYANGQILAQYDGHFTDEPPYKYFTLHDRLGSVRLIIDTSGNVKNRYTYNPFGEKFSAETEENVTNNFLFTGQCYDSEIGQYYLRARMYDPAVMRFTARDPVFGQLQQPLTLHKYLYCGNDPMNRIDITGRWWVNNWFGHPELTFRSMRKMNFTDDFEVGWAIIGNIMTDYRDDHYTSWLGGIGNVPHFVPGKEDLALWHAQGALEIALWYEKKGMHIAAMMILGTGLHTMQDKWAHSEQGAGWSEHFPKIGTDPDNPWKHPLEYEAAYEESLCYIQKFIDYSEKGIVDIDLGGEIGDGYIESDVHWDAVQDALDALVEQGAVLLW